MIAHLSEGKSTRTAARPQGRVRTGSGAAVLRDPTICHRSKVGQHAEPPGETADLGRLLFSREAHPATPPPSPSP